ncbi:MAG: NTP transferase domain-containing protein [Phycisphaeraceae bacterium]|nr:NTP transferase domain-containing protein [Phycisphaeraceae bacterium]
MPKALVHAGREPWWQTQLYRLREARIESIWVLSPEVHAIIGASSLAPAKFVLSDSSRPMFASIRAGIDSLRVNPPGGVYILPIDVPAPRDHALWLALRSSEVPTAATFEGIRGHPIFVPWSWITSTLDPRLAAASDPDALRLDELLRPSVLRIPVSDPVVACNLNTPEDFRRFVESPAPDAHS